jgi:hypothetical protein
VHLLARCSRGSPAHSVTSSAEATYRRTCPALKRSVVINLYIGQSLRNHPGASTNMRARANTRTRPRNPTMRAPARAHRGSEQRGGGEGEAEPDAAAQPGPCPAVDLCARLREVCAAGGGRAPGREQAAAASKRQRRPPQPDFGMTVQGQRKPAVSGSESGGRRSRPQIKSAVSTGSKQHPGHSAAPPSHAPPLPSRGSPAWRRTRGTGGSSPPPPPSGAAPVAAHAAAQRNPTRRPVAVHTATVGGALQRAACYVVNTGTAGVACKFILVPPREHGGA